MISNSHFLKHLGPTTTNGDAAAPAKPVLPDEATTATTKEASNAATHFRYQPVSEEIFRHLKNTQATYLEIVNGENLYDPICKYMAEKAKSIQSWRLEVNRRNNKHFNPYDDEEEEAEKVRRETLKLGLGLGVHEIAFKGDKVKLIHQVIGDPVGCNCGVELYTSLVLFVEAPNKEQVLKNFCQEILEWSHKADDKKYNIYSWIPRNMYWHLMASKTIRPIESVILPQKVKDLVVTDLADFCSRETARWYVDHGVPYKRSMLFYGPPGMGKSSLITALAGVLNRHVCFLQPSHPEITDDNLQKAIQQAPAKSLIVMEDVDALFDKTRKSEVRSSPLTFSGLLNALDGVCNPEGQIFILTTNHIERLDPALIRAGRVDVKIPFPSATARQAELLFLHFYPKAEEQARQFASIMYQRFPSKHQGEEFASKTAKEVLDVAMLEGWTDSHRLAVSMASLQQHFISCRKVAAAEAVVRAKSDFEPDNQEELEEKRKEDEEKKKKEEEEEEAKKKEKGKDKTEDADD